MSRAKDEMMRREEQVREATDIAVEAGVLRRCKLHPEIVLDNYVDHPEAYKLGNALFNAGKLQADFQSRDELNDAIKDAIQASERDGCFVCARALGD